MALSKGIAVVSGSNDYVFRAAETGVITMGSDITQARITITGSMTMTGDFVLNGTNVTDELTRLDERVEEVYNDLDLSDLDSVKELADLFKITSSLHYSTDETIFGWQTHGNGNLILTSQNIQNYSGDLDDYEETAYSLFGGVLQGSYISRGRRKGWEFDKTSDAETTLDSAAAIEWFLYRDNDKSKNLSVSDLDSAYAVITIDETGAIPRFDLYTHPEGSDDDITSQFASRWEYAATGNETFNAGEKILLYFGSTAPQVHPSLRRVQLSLLADDGNSLTEDDSTSLWYSSTSKGLRSSSEIVRFISLRTLSSETHDFTVEKMGYVATIDGKQRFEELELEIAPATKAEMDAADNSLASSIADLADDLDTEATTRGAKDLSLNTRISAEEVLRLSSDTSLGSKISAETYRADSVETSIANKYGAISSSLSSEIVRAGSVEGTLDSRISTVSSSLIPKLVQSLVHLLPDLKM